MTKRKPINTAESAVKAMVDAAMGQPEVPAHVYLRAGDKPFWDGVCRARTREEWTESDLVVAAQLARCQADIERESKLLDKESSTLKNDRGTLVGNPRFSVIEQLARREMALMRGLRMTGAVAGDVRNEIPRRAAARAAEQVRAEIEDDGLLAK